MSCLPLPTAMLTSGRAGLGSRRVGAWVVWDMCLCIHGKCLRASVKAYIVCVCERERDFVCMCAW